MRKAIAIVGFVYGCVGSLLSLVWVLFALTEGATWQIDASLAVVVLVVHGTVIVVTLHREPLGSSWRPVVSVTPWRVRAATVLLGGGLLNFAAWLAFVVITRSRGALRAYDLGLPLIVASLALLTSTYVAVHWAFRPENLFSQGLLQAAAFPLRFLFRHDDQSRRLHG